ncbi:hypothetical protein ABZ883_02975 [Streptomyces sp. NPDC046977]|uniref:DUF6907 domain-containing protein n=1 Tax=Streptomyces sp. NPDC046977 TaxID=3154703 RepID=UPI0033D91506
MSTTVGDAGAPRRVIAIVDDSPVEIECPAWCVIDHESDSLVDLADVHHNGPEISVSIPTGTGPRRVLTAWMSAWPYGLDLDGTAAGMTTAGLAVDDPAASTGECENLSAAQLTAFADQLSAHVDQLRRLAEQLSAANGGAW